MKLQKIERRQVIAFQKDLSEGGLSIRTCNNIMKILKIVLKDAITDEIIMKNPVTFNEDNTKTTGTPKSESGKRDIPLNDMIKGVLARQRKKQSIVIPIDKAENRVFVSVYGKIVDNGAVNRAISAALSRLEEQGKPIGHFTAHALRDTFATRYIEQGGSPRTLKTILGHSSLMMTMDLCSHVLPNTKQKEMDSLKIVL